MSTQEATTVQETITLGGREFESAEVSTLEHDCWFLERLGEAELDQVVIGENETADDFARGLMHRVMREGHVFRLLAGLIVPVGGTWSPEVARDTAAFLAQLTETEDKEEVTVLISSMLLDFFERGLSSIVTSPGSPLAQAQPGQSSNEHGTVSGATASSFALSLADMRTAQRKSSQPGRSEMPSWRSRISSWIERWRNGGTKT